MTALGIAVRALTGHRVRSALTMLGITIGVAAVICTVAIGEGGAEQVRQQLDAIGDTFIWISAGNRNLGGVRTGSGGARTLTTADTTAIVKSVIGVTSCSPQMSGREQLVSGNRNWNSRYIGVTPEYFSIRRWRLAEGSAFTQDDVAHAERVVVLGSAVAAELFDDEADPEPEIRLGPFTYRVIGVLQPRGASSPGVNQDDIAILPVTTAARYLDNRPWVDDVMCSASSVAALPVAELGITELLRERHRLDGDTPDDFTVRQPEDWINLRVDAAERLTAMVAGLASIALLIGGIGVMNIMLVAVAERTREIGLRLALGARTRDVRRQFLVESVLLGFAGGVAGILLGTTGAQLITAAYALPLHVTAKAVALAVTASAGSGFVFGYLPAVRAAALDPIEALRTEN